MCSFCGDLRERCSGDGSHLAQVSFFRGTRLELALDFAAFHVCLNRNWRWTNGEAVLPGDLWAERDTDMFLTVEFDQAASFCWVAPPIAGDEVHTTTNVVEIRRAG